MDKYDLADPTSTLGGIRVRDPGLVLELMPRNVASALIVPGRRHRGSLLSISVSQLYFLSVVFDKPASLEIQRKTSSR